MATNLITLAAEATSGSGAPNPFVVGGGVLLLLLALLVAVAAVGGGREHS